MIHWLFLFYISCFWDRFEICWNHEKYIYKKYLGWGMTTRGTQKTSATFQKSLLFIYTEQLRRFRRVAQTLLVSLYSSEYMNDVPSCTTLAELYFDDALSWFVFKKQTVSILHKWNPHGCDILPQYHCFTQQNTWLAFSPFSPVERKQSCLLVFILQSSSKHIIWLLYPKYQPSLPTIATVMNPTGFSTSR